MAFITTTVALDIYPWPKSKEFLESITLRQKKNFFKILNIRQMQLYRKVSDTA